MECEVAIMGKPDPNYVKNNLPYDQKVAILVTSWMGHKKWWSYTFNSYRQAANYIICAFDNHCNRGNPQDYEYILPPKDIFALADAWVFKHRTYDADKRNGWLWNMVYAQGILSQFDNLEYIFTINGDCCLDKPKGMSKLIKILGDADVMSQASDGSILHTCSCIYRADAFNMIYTYIKNQMKTLKPESYSPEVILAEAVNELGLKEKIAPVQPVFPDDYPVEEWRGVNEFYSAYNQDSTWKRIVGFRNLDAENETKVRERLEPIPAKYFDSRKNFSNGYEQESILKYYETKDRRYLYMFHDFGEDSWYDRRHYTVDFYGDEPIYDKEVKE